MNWNSSPAWEPDAAGWNPEVRRPGSAPLAMVIAIGAARLMAASGARGAGPASVPGWYTGRWTYKGVYRSWMKLTGRPETSPRRTWFQSVSPVFSTMAQA